jgi:hypothetical protein
LAGIGLTPTLAQEEEARLVLMATQTGSLDSETAWQEWRYSPGGSPSTLTVETLAGNLDPALEVRNGEGVLIASNNDYAPSFSTAAQLSLPAAPDYVVRVLAQFGQGEYRLSASPGQMTPQWDENFTRPNPQWAISNATPLDNAIQLQTPLTTTRLFIPNNAPPITEGYIQASFRWGETRAESNAGLALRARPLSNGQIEGLRLEARPDGAWRLQINDGQGAETLLAEGQFQTPPQTLTLGLLVQDGSVAAYANGALLTSLETDSLPAQSAWGIVMYDAQILLEGFRMASPVRVAPIFPDQITTWADPQSTVIGAELIELGLMPPSSQRAAIIPQTQYTVTGVEQRNFLLTEESRLFGTVALGGEVIVREGADVGCGLVGRFLSREEKILVYSDTQGGAGLLWWDGVDLDINDYSFPPSLDPVRNRLLLILDGEYAAFYLNGQLTAQALIPLRLGNVGVGFVNFGGGTATCDFQNVWIWE